MDGAVPGLQDVFDDHEAHLDPVIAASLDGLVAVQLGGQVLPQVCLPEVLVMECLYLRVKSSLKFCCQDSYRLQL